MVSEAVCTGLPGKSPFLFALVMVPAAMGANNMFLLAAVSSMTVLLAEITSDIWDVTGVYIMCLGTEYPKWMLFSVKSQFKFSRLLSVFCQYPLYTRDYLFMLVKGRFHFI